VLPFRVIRNVRTHYLLAALSRQGSPVRLLPNIPSSVCSSILRILQLLCLPLLRELPGCVPTIPNLERFLFPLFEFRDSSFHISCSTFNFGLPTSASLQLSHFPPSACALFCAFLHFLKTQSLSLQAIPHSFAKIDGFVERACE
jgi:hypothetical protein